MWDLFKAEWMRFRAWALAAAVVHLLVLGFMTRLVDLAQQPLLVYRVFGGVYALAGLLLGLYQMGSYRRPGMWLNLLHRPLPPHRIVLAVCAAAALVLVVAVMLPILVIAGWQVGMTARVVDLRHWLLPLAATLIACCSYLAGAYAILANRRHALGALLVLAWFLISEATGWRALLVQALALAWLLAMVLAVFRPDPLAPPRGVAATWLSALPLQMLVYVAGLLLCFGIEMLWVVQGSHPNNTPAPPPGGHNEVEKMQPQPRMLAALSASDHPDAPLLREQIALSEVMGVGATIYAIPVRSQLVSRQSMEFDDPRRRVRWVFSHDTMRYQGYGLGDSRGVGAFANGPGGQPFPQPVIAEAPLPGWGEGDAMLLAGNTLYQYDSEAGHAVPRLVLPGDEHVLGANPVGESLGVISERAVYFFNTRELADSTRLLSPRQRVALPGPYGELRDMDLIELADGYLIAFTCSAGAHKAWAPAPYQQVLRVDGAGRVEVVARRPLRYDYPELYRYRSWWWSPAMASVSEGLERVLGEPDPLRATTRAPLPRAVLILALALAMLSVAFTAWLLRKRPLSWPGRMAWLATSAVVGLPAPISLWLLQPATREPPGTAHAGLAPTGA